MATPEPNSETPQRSNSLLAFSTAVGGLGVLHFATVRLGPLYSLLTTAIGLAGIVVIVRPYIAIYMILALRIAIDMLWWLDRIGRMSSQQVTSGVLSILIGVVALAVVRRPWRHPQWTSLMGFLLLAVLGAVQTGDVFTAIDQFLRIAAPLLLALIVTELLDTPAYRRYAVITIAGCLVVPLVIALYNLALGQLGPVLDGYKRLHGPYQSFQNLSFAMTFSCSTGLMLWRWWRDRNPWWSLAALVYTAGSGVALYYTYARTPAIGVAVFTLCFLTLSRRFALVVGSVVALGVAIAANPVLQDRYDDVMIAAVTDNEIEAKSVGSGRFAMWQETIDRYVENRPFQQLFGAGLGRDRLDSRFKVDAHNDYLSILYQLGPIGALLTLWFHALVAMESWRLAKFSKDPWNIIYGHFMFSVSAMCVVANTLSNAYVSRAHSAWLYWALAGLTFAANADDPDVGPLRGRPMAPTRRFSGS